MRIFRENHVKNILDLGCGQGRDTKYFAEQGFDVTGTDYSMQALSELNNIDRITTKYCDLRSKLPFENNTFDACYSHMLLCMAFSMKELKNLMSEVRRVLKPAGIVSYTVRHTGDFHYMKGTSHGESMYETDGFIIHFFNARMIQELSEGFEIMQIKKFEEGALPRKLFEIIMRKNPG